MTKYSISAPAKINLYLDVLSKRENGYHNIKSVMQTVSLCDEITMVVEKSKKNKIKLSGSSNEIKWDKKNLVYRACELFLQETGITGYTFTIYVEKIIPVCAGMAGGSTDAAATLLLLNQYFDDMLPIERLCELGARLGADVAFCIHGGTCLCEGVGEILTPIKSLAGLYVVCAIDSSSVSTPQAFAMLDEKFGTNCTDSSNIEEFLASVENGSPTEICSKLYNKFESVILPALPNTQQIKKILLDNGALGALMSGSGPSIFGIFENEEACLNAYVSLVNADFTAFLTKTI